jgi:hypothetical protein
MKPNISGVQRVEVASASQGSAISLNDHIQAVADSLAKDAQRYAETNGNPIAITRHVMEMGIQAAAAGSFNVAMAKQLAGMMIAAISLATLESAGQGEKL